MPTGTVSFVHERDNYGFIETDAADDDVFFHQSFIDEDLSEGEAVEFDIEDDDRGPQATNLRRA